MDTHILVKDWFTSWELSQVENFRYRTDQALRGAVQTDMPVQWT